MSRVFFDLETRSRVDLRKTGAYRYAEDESTEILMMTYAVDDEPVQVVEGDAAARELFAEWVADPDVKFVAHNAEFDLAVMGFTDFDRCEDTAAMAAILGYPRALGALATTLGVTEKLPEGKALIQLFSKPSRRKGAPFNDKETHPEKWQTFIDYAKIDVIAMRDCYRLLEWPPGELEVWRANAKVNARGLPLDVDLAIAAEKVGEENTVRMKAEMEQLLGIENAGSVAQLTAALDMSSMDKAAVSERLAAPDLPPHHRRALELRQSTALSSHKKFTAAKTAVCADGRGRGMFVYAAAGTGRFSSRTLQLQNLSREGFPDDLTTECVVEEVKKGFGASQAELRKLVRGLILGPIAVADYAQIEARMTSWLSDDQDALDVFRGGGDIYVATAERMSTATRKYSRQEGKVACIAEGSTVLTSNGLKPIEEVTTTDFVWDGVEWVAHDGVVFKGTREVIEHDGLVATADHLVWVEGSEKPIRFGLAAESGSRLTQSAAGRSPIRVLGGERDRAALHTRLGSALRGGGMHKMRGDSVGSLGESAKEKIGSLFRLPRNTGAFRTEEVGQSSYRSETAVPEPERSQFFKLRRSRDNLRLPFRSGRGVVGAREPWSAPERKTPAGSDRQRPGLRAGELEVGNLLGEQQEQTDLHYPRSGSRRGLAILSVYRGKNAAAGPYTGTDHGVCERSCSQQEEELEDYQEATARVERVYDILNAGPRARFTVNGKLVHNCLALGFGGGANALKNFGAEGSDEELWDIVNSWRKANHRTVRLWKDLWNGLLRGGQVRDNIRVERDGRDRGVVLPSGRTIWYRDIRKHGEEFSYANPERQGGRSKLYSGIVINNVVQGSSRCITATAIKNAVAEGLDVIGHVHDEILTTGTDVTKLVEVMERPLPWSEGLPIKAAGDVLPYRYRKA